MARCVYTSVDTKTAGPDHPAPIRRRSHLKRIKLVLAALAAMATLVVVTASPAMAQPVGCFFDANGNLVCPNGFFPNQFVTSPFNTSGTTQGFSERRIQSGPANPVTNVSNTGD